MKQSSIIDRLDKLEEQHQELYLMAASAIRLLVKNGILTEESLKRTIADIVRETIEEEAYGETDIYLPEIDTMESQHEMAYRREYRRRDIPEPDYETELENYRLEAERRDAAPAHHYHFVHRILRDFCQDGHEFFFSAMSDPAGNRRFLGELWRSTCEDCATTGKPGFSQRDIETHALVVNNFPAIITIMPPPEHINEAYMAAAVLLVPMEEFQSEKPLISPEIAFITLERSYYEIPIVGAWKGMEHHFLAVTENLTPTDIKEDPMRFVNIVEKLLATDRQSVAWKSVGGMA